MRIIENSSWLAHSGVRSAYPAPARDALTTSSQPVDDSVASAAADGVTKREARVAELKGQYQDGRYSADLKEVSSKLVDRHVGQTAE